MWCYTFRQGQEPQKLQKNTHFGLLMFAQQDFVFPKKPIHWYDIIFICCILRLVHNALKYKRIKMKNLFLSIMPNLHVIKSMKCAMQFHILTVHATIKLRIIYCVPNNIYLFISSQWSRIFAVYNHDFGVSLVFSMFIFQMIEILARGDDGRNRIYMHYQVCPIDSC